VPLEIARWLPEFPVRDNCLYLNHAAVAPLPRRVVAAMQERLADMQAHGSHNWERWQETELGTRSLAAELVGCRPEDISLIRSTSEGISMIAQGLGLKKGDVVLVAEEDFASNVAPYLALQPRGVVVRRYPNPRGRINPDEVAMMLGPKVKALALSWVAFHTGWVAPVAELAAAAHKAGAVVVLDAIQGLGALPDRMDDLGVDALVADGHKWLLAPEGLGIMATRPELRARLQPVLAGWLNVRRDGHDMFLRELEFHADGRRFEPGAMPNVLLAGLHAAVDLLLEAGMANVAERVAGHNRALTRNLLEVGWQVGSPGSANPVAGIVAGKHPFLPAHEAARRLRERHIEVTARQGWVRFSPHFYATVGELDALRVILGKL
jgi:cysteine desulfurase / selenocysteine lyase